MVSGLGGTGSIPKAFSHKEHVGGLIARFELNAIATIKSHLSFLSVVSNDFSRIVNARSLSTLSNISNKLSLKK